MLEEIIKAALKEDDAFKDITSDLTIPEGEIVSFEITPRERIIFCGQEVVLEIFAQLRKSKKFKESELDLEIHAEDGDAIKSGELIVSGSGSAKLIFAAERVMLNLIQHLSGISTLTKEFVTTLKDKNIKILDTRKTLPTFRALQKYAVLKGGGSNHRFNLSEMIMIKDNHIAAAGGIKKAILAAKTSKKKVEVECDNPVQVKIAVGLAPDIIMLDNMSITDIKQSIALIKESKNEILIEVSGGITLENIKKYNGLAIDFISVGSLTHSARAVDIGLDIK
jgi:nicotinate-nucleotide pyrophosphorylase (carboxylating)